VILTRRVTSAAVGKFCAESDAIGCDELLYGRSEYSSQKESVSGKVMGGEAGG
jgi:hypothetical protein